MILTIILWQIIAYLCTYVSILLKRICYLSWLYILVDLVLNLIYSAILLQKKKKNTTKPKKQEKKHWSNFSILFPSLLPPFFFSSYLIAVLLPLLTMG